MNAASKRFWCFNLRSRNFERMSQKFKARNKIESIKSPQAPYLDIHQEVQLSSETSSQRNSWYNRCVSLPSWQPGSQCELELPPPGEDCLERYVYETEWWNERHLSLTSRDNMQVSQLSLESKLAKTVQRAAADAWHSNSLGNDQILVFNDELAFDREWPNCSEYLLIVRAHPSFQVLPDNAAARRRLRWLFRRQRIGPARPYWGWKTLGPTWTFQEAYHQAVSTLI